MPFNLSTGEILVLLVVAVVLFGGRLPEVARKVGRSLSELKRGMSDEVRKIDAETGSIEKVWDEPPDARECDGTGVVEQPGDSGPEPEEATPRPS